VSVLVPPRALLRSTYGPWIRRFVRQVESARLTGTLTSWYRDEARNAAVGGVPRSLHLVGLAIDYVPRRGEWSADSAALKAAGLRVLNEGDHLHVSA
jgi:hypothetical protein